MDKYEDFTLGDVLALPEDEQKAIGAGLIVVALSGLVGGLKRGLEGDSDE